VYDRSRRDQSAAMCRTSRSRASSSPPLANSLQWRSVVARVADTPKIFRMAQVASCSLDQVPAMKTRYEGERVNLGGMTLAVPGATGFVALAQRAVIVVSGSCHRPGSGTPSDNSADRSSVDA
jgi:hypothetical protein